MNEMDWLLENNNLAMFINQRVCYKKHVRGISTYVFDFNIHVFTFVNKGKC